MESDVMFKVCIFGDGGVGKTTLTERYLTGKFKADLHMTIGTNFYRKDMKMDGLEISLQIWDFGGERMFRTLFPRYFMGSHGGIFMYDITRYSSLNHLDEWMKIVENDEVIEDIPPLLIVGGKLDLEGKRNVFKEEIKHVMKQNDFIDHVECSAKTGKNVEKIFSKLTKAMLKKI